MVDSEEKISFIPLVIGLIFLGFIFYIVYAILIAPNPQYQPGFYVFLGLIAVSLAVIIYFCIKNPEFKEKTLNAVHVFTLGLSRIGDNIIKNYQEGASKKRKERKPPSQEVKNKVYNLAADKCQICGKRGNLKIHHINGDPSNNRITNLILLCGNCHDDADKGVISKWRLKDARIKQKTAGYVSVSK